MSNAVVARVVSVYLDAINGKSVLKRSKAIGEDPFSPAGDAQRLRKHLPEHEALAISSNVQEIVWV